ncbi:MULTISPECIES: 50S ribosomal protein L25 [Anaerolinea]|uniref:Large ribosomal subunit protein bL25 n=1 Tax=Anaerolinea thermophila (strain DSM 14523 / JCM 11388 / NBRC 100420 / UNI-1) TaxID=926569 RepID=E8N4Z3_ANATU|nr:MULTISPECIES: 50S ribosomal protein L25 [Anaerolinea]BAJ63507.1 50S ribosomal protein L25 [Anaerolinea thermophila UNI-1]
MEKIVLQAQRRTLERTAKALRREGYLPAVMYGAHFPSTPILLDAHNAGLKLAKVSSSTLVYIELDGETHAALVREKQRDYIKNRLLHVDFQVVSLTEKIRTTVSLHFEGVSPAVKDYNGVVVTSLDEVEVEALPQDLPERIVVDLSKLARIGDTIHVRDLEVAKGVKVLNDPDEVVVVVSTTTEEVEAPAEGELSEPEVIERGKKEEEVE